MLLRLRKIGQREPLVQKHKTEGNHAFYPMRVSSCFYSVLIFLPMACKPLESAESDVEMARVKLATAKEIFIPKVVSLKMRSECRIS